MMLRFSIAEKLGKTLREVTEGMSYEELLGWSVYFELQYEAEKKAMEKARMEADSKRRRRR